MVQRGHLVKIVATDIGSAGRTDVFADVLIPHIAGGPLRRLRQYAFYPAAYRELRRVFTSFKPDLVHFHTVGELSPAALFAAWGIPFVMTVHGPEDFARALTQWQLPASDYRDGTYRREDIRPSGRLRSLYLHMVQRPVYLAALRRCSALIAPSSYMADVLAKEVSPRRIVHIYNGIELPEAAAPPGRGRFLFVGRLEPIKGADVLLRAFALARGKCPGISLTIAGDGAARADLEALASQLDLGNDVVFLGRVPAAGVVHAMAAADAIVIPSVSPDILPTVAIEAMGVGRPILGSRVGGIPELVAEGVTGLVTESGDAAALAQAMVRLASDPQLCPQDG